MYNLKYNLIILGAIMANYNDLAELIFPNITDTVEDLEKKYPKSLL